MDERREFWNLYNHSDKTSEFRKLRLAKDYLFTDLANHCKGIESGHTALTMAEVDKIKALGLLALQARSLIVREGAKVPDEFQPQVEDVLQQTREKLDSAFRVIAEINRCVAALNVTEYNPATN
jgi:hypothetical protein